MNSFWKNIMAAAWLIASLSGYGQISETPWQGVSSASNSLREKLTGETFHYEYRSEGSHFYHPEFTPAKITLENGEIIRDIRSRYNSFLDELVCFNPNLNSLFIIDKFKVREFELTSVVYGFQKFVRIESDNFRSGSRYFHVIYEGNLTLLTFYQTKAKKTGLYRDSYGSLNDSELVIEETYYLYHKDSGLNKFLPTEIPFILYSVNIKRKSDKFCVKTGCTVSILTASAWPFR